MHQYNFITLTETLSIEKGASTSILYIWLPGAVDVMG